MELDQIRQHCFSRGPVTEERARGTDVVTFKVGGKPFCFYDVDDGCLSVKTIPEIGAGLRELHAAVGPGRHISQSSWNTIQLDGSVSRHELLDWIDTSFKLVVHKLDEDRRRTLGLRDSR